MAHWRLYLTAIMLALLCGTWCLAERPSFPPVPQEGSADPVPALSQQPLPPDVREKLYREELGDLFHPADLPQLMHGHELLEEYFAASKSADRKAIVTSLEQTHLPPGVLGRLARLRLHWPALAGGVYYVNERRGPYGVQYFLGIPEGYDRGRAWPLVVKLAEPGAFLTNPPPDAQRVVDLYNAWIKADLAAHPDAIEIMPLLDIELFYGPSQAGMNRVIQPMLDAADRVNIDPSQVYLIGHGAAASAAWNLVLQYPTYFAAFAPLAGEVPYDWQRLRLIDLRNTLPVVWNDVDDKAVRIEMARSMINALRGQKIDVDYQQTRGNGHNPTDAIVDERYQKMRAMKRVLYPKRVSLQSDRPETQFNRDDWLQIWQEATPGTDRRLLLRNGEIMWLHETPAKLDATLGQNQIDATVENVASLRFYLNDQMVDLSKPLTIAINRNKKVQGFVKQSIDEMLKDQILLGRGWRYFTAAVDIDLIPAPTTRPATRPATTRSTTQPRKGRIIVGPGAAD